MPLTAFLKDEILLVLCNMGAIARRHRKAGRLQAMEYHPINPVFPKLSKKNDPHWTLPKKTTIGDIRRDSCGILDRGRSMIIAIPMWT